MTIGTISPREAQTLATRDVELIDICDADEYLHEHIPEAHLVPPPTFEQGSLPVGLRAKQVIFHCQSGEHTRNMVAKLSVIAAPAQVWLLRGGISDWKAAGLPMAKNSLQPLPLMRQVQVAVGSLAPPDAIPGYSASSAFFLLSGFAGAELIPAGVTGFYGMAQLLDIMPWNRRAY